MSEVTVKQLATVVGIPVERLLTQLDEAGLRVDGPESSISEEDKLLLLNHLRRSHGKGEAGELEAGPRKVTLRRKTVSELKQKAPSSSSRGLRAGAPGGKTVSVEVRKRRTYVKRSAVVEPEERLREADEARKVLEERDRVRAAEEDAARARQAEEDRELAEQARVEEEVRRQEEEVKRRLEEEEAARIAEEARRVAAEQAAAEARAMAEQQARVAAEAEARAAAEAAVKAAAIREAAAAAEPAFTPEPAAAKEATKAGKGAGRRGSKERETGFGRKELHVAAGKQGRRKQRGKGGRAAAPVARGEGKHGFERPTAPIVRDVELGQSITVGDLAQRMSVKAAEVIKALMKLGSMVTINQTLDQETAAIVVEEMGHNVVMAAPKDVETVILEEEDALEGEELPRAPVVTIMGHVDHGKTS
ncbi:MAG: translation initiation factor IF-2 N-terminal domain-containing protein, partial [Chromatiales bacterium]|nr:translation initiation factor IF-2 N-terminal domain-containing protein [Chromatiales bacterium]